jgi:hypothetical protein
VITKARKSIAAFKLRENVPIGCKVTLRGDRMYEFLDRLMTIALPRIRDFRGINPGSFDGRGNFAMGVREQVVEERPSYDKETGAFTGTSTYERPVEEAPGISQLLVAEVLDHAIFFSLGDLGKALPQYEEIALPVEMDADTYEQYDRTRQQLKDYLIQRRWEGDTTFCGAYLQWAMGWPNAAHRPHEVVDAVVLGVHARVVEREHVHRAHRE